MELIKKSFGSFFAAVMRCKKCLIIISYIVFILLLIELTNNNIANFFFLLHPEQQTLNNKKTKQILSTDEIFINFITGIAHNNREIAQIIYKHTKNKGLDTFFYLALIKTESNFNIRAINKNKDGSLDRGIAQLNSRTFPDLELEDFYDPDINIDHSTDFIKWALEQAKNNEVLALAYYNAGYGKVSGKDVGRITLNYINKIMITRDKYKNEFYEYQKDFSNDFTIAHIENNSDNSIRKSLR